MAGQGPKALNSGGSGGIVWEWFPAVADGWKGMQEVCLPLDRTVDFIYKELAISRRERKTSSLHSNINVLPYRCKGFSSQSPCHKVFSLIA